MHLLWINVLPLNDFRYDGYTQSFSSIFIRKLTPPWIRRQVVSGKSAEFASQVAVFLEGCYVPRPRQQKNGEGNKRLAYILAAFYIEEKFFAREYLKHLLAIVPNVDGGNVKKSKITSNENRRRVVSVRNLEVTIPRNQGENRDASNEENYVRTDPVRNEERGLTALRPASPSSDSDISELERLHRHAVRYPTVNRNSTARHTSHDSRDTEDEATTVREPNDVYSPTLRRNARRLQITSIDLNNEEEGKRGGPPSPTSEDSDEGETHRSSRNNRPPDDLCANGEKCRFAGTVFNGPGAISGRCRQCRHRLHDFCGGGEDGYMVCGVCIEDRNRRLIHSG